MIMLPRNVDYTRRWDVLQRAFRGEWGGDPSTTAVGTLSHTTGRPTVEKRTRPRGAWTTTRMRTTPVPSMDHDIALQCVCAER